MDVAKKLNLFDEIHNTAGNSFHNRRTQYYQPSSQLVISIVQTQYSI